MPFTNPSRYILAVDTIVGKVVIGSDFASNQSVYGGGYVEFPAGPFEPGWFISRDSWDILHRPFELRVLISESETTMDPGMFFYQDGMFVVYSSGYLDGEGRASLTLEGRPGPPDSVAPANVVLAPSVSGYVYLGNSPDRVGLRWNPGPYSALAIKSGKGGYSGIRFEDEDLTLMVDGAGATGMYRGSAGPWVWYFDSSGALAAGTVPWGRVTGVPASVGAAANYLVQYSVNGYIYGNYINMTADAAAGRAVYLAGQNGDNFMRWFNPTTQLVGYVWMSDRSDYRLNIGWNGSYWRCQSLAWPSGAYQGGLIVDRADALSQRDAKINVEPAAPDYDKIFSLQQVTFDYDPNHQQVSETLLGDGRHLGYFVEDLHDLGLTEFVLYDPHGKPWSIDYASLAVTMIPLVKDLRERVAALEQR